MFCCDALGQAELQTIQLYTPKGVAFNITTHEEAAQHTLAALDTHYKTLHGDAVFISGSTYTYNCLGYAFVMVEGSGVQNKRTGQLDEINFLAFTSGSNNAHKSYVQATEADHDMVFFEGASDVHAALKQPNGKYRSKWGAAGPLMEHDRDDLPHAWANMTKKYYKKAPATTISSPIMLPSIPTIPNFTR